MDDLLSHQNLSPLAPVPTGIEPRGALTLPLKCLMCDIYGTLLISGSGDIGTSRRHAGAGERLERLLARHRIAIPAAELPDRLHAAIQEQHAAARQAGVDVPEVNIDAVWAQILNMASPREARSFAMGFELIINPVWPMPGLDTLLSRCRQMDLRLGIISNAQFYTLPLLRHFLDADETASGFHPQLIFLSYRHGCAKPSVRLFELAVAALQDEGITPDQVAFVGNDMLNDILPARDAGFQTVLFAGDERSLRTRTREPACAGVRPDLVVTHLGQLAAALGQDG